MKLYQLNNMQRWRLHGCSGSIRFALGALGWLTNCSFVSANTREVATDFVNNIELLGRCLAEDLKNKTWKTHTQGD